MNKSKVSSFEGQVTKISAAVSLTLTLFILVLLIQADFSLYLKLIFLFFLTFFVGLGNFFIWNRVRNQLRSTTNVVEAIISGDTSMRANSFVASGALSELNSILNSASQTLAEQRLVSKEHHLAMSKVLEYINVAVIAVDENAVVTLLNPTARKMLALESDMVGMPIKQLGIDRTLIDKPIQQVVTLTTDKVNKRVYLQTDSYRLSGKTYGLLFFNDVQKLLQDEEREAWQRLLRVLRHEINNSLAPIASIGESLSRMVNTHESDEELKQDLLEGLNIITNRSMALDSFIKEYQTLAKLPMPTKSLFSLSEFVGQQTELFTDFKTHVENDADIEIFADRDQLSQVLVNLLKNAQQSCTEVNTCSAQIDWQIREQFIQISVSDNGAGVSNPDNLFIPFYTTKAEGSGIGLVLSRQIIFNHGGDLTLTNRTDAQGAVATITLPILSN